MKKLIKSETYKLFKLSLYTFLLFLALAFAEFDNIVYMRVETGVEWINYMPVLYIYIIILIFILTADFVGGDFSNRTLMPALLCGEPRWKLVFAKYAAILIGTIPILTVYELTGVIMVTLRNELGISLNLNFLLLVIKSNIYCIIENLVITGIALLMSLIIKNKLCLVLSGFCAFYFFYVITANLRFMTYAVREVWETILQFFIIYQMVAPSSYQTYIPFSLVLSTSIVAVVITLSASVYIFAKKNLK